jgi:hypothetical protein
VSDKKRAARPWWHWRPISTLTRTGGEIIVHTKRGYVGIYPVVTVRAWRDDPDAASIGAPVPTHWMPLPPPPKKT